jgi:phospholipase/lecithinase/hemolysin
MVRMIRADRKVEDVDPGIARATGQVTVGFADATLRTQAQNGTAAEFALRYMIDANRSLTSTLHEVSLALAKANRNTLKEGCSHACSRSTSRPGLIGSTFRAACASKSSP